MTPTTVDIKIANIEKSIGKIERSLEGLAKTLADVAIQDVRIINLTTRVDACWKKLENVIIPIAQSCPKDQVRWLWYIIIPMGLTQIALSMVLIKMFFTVEVLV